MTSDEKQWTAVWGAWVAFFAVAETVAVRSGKPVAPFTHHLRRSLGIGGKPLHRAAGQIAIGTGVVWVVSHLYERALDQVNGSEVR
jgi:hypothetical protein